MAIPAGDKRSVIPLHRLTFYDEVFKNFVKSRTHMNIAISEWGAIMEQESGGILSLTFAYNSFVELRILPLLEAGGFFFSQIATHGEGGIGQEDSIFIAFGLCAHTRVIIQGGAAKVKRLVSELARKNLATGSVLPVACRVGYAKPNLDRAVHTQPPKPLILRRQIYNMRRNISQAAQQR